MLTEYERNRLAEANPDALLADGFEEAYIGICYRFNLAIAAYDYDKCIDVLMKRDGMSYEEAVEFFEFNTLGAWVGEGTPAFIKDIERCNNAECEGHAEADDPEADASGC
jgi:hypothetical protein